MITHETLKKLPFTENNIKKVFFKMDKTTRIVGCCTEQHFIEQLIQPKYKEYSSGFWFNKHKGKYQCFKLISYEPTETDKKIMSFFNKKDINCFIIKFDYPTRNFYYKQYPVKDKWKVFPHNNAEIEIQTRHIFPESIDKSFTYLKNKNVLYDVVIERIFANYYLHYGFDIDCFTLDGNKLSMFEVKQKYPTRGETYGLNEHMKTFFGMLNDIGIITYYVILTKPREKGCNIDMWDKGEWLITKIDPKQLELTGYAPKKTGMYGTHGYTYYHIPVSDFRLINSVVYSERKE